MKLATFVNTDGKAAIGVVDTVRKAILDLSAASGGDADFRDMLALIDAGRAGLEKARAVAANWPDAAVRPLAGTKLLAPLPEPRQMRDCLVFEAHLLNSRDQQAKRSGTEPPPIPDVWYEQPVYYKGNRFSVV
ncbi:MAG: fumarylacetoacetate hydrolase family protein, partial [Rhizobiales bacterium]|nr:fumarylacetoacetate hydrolase family protein [Hyphomicrobiales bacterium]